MDKLNRLSMETSPYLLQHAENPVDWYPWGDEAFARARAENKPILLSIGYSACHWCHVMAHESFEDKATAGLMNDLFINIKVDREERPDIDKIYQLAHAALSRRGGGWPLTIFMTADQVPFFTGTYFPNTPRYNMPSFKDTMIGITQYLKSNREEVQKQNQSIQEFFRSLSAEKTAAKTTLNISPLIEVKQELLDSFDTRFGGFGAAPKFPHTGSIDRAFRIGRQEENPHMLNIATTTLKQMALGGIYDQLGGGFSRYSVDEEWMIPHFEKMLYDNALLLVLYAQASLLDGPYQKLFTRITIETAEYVQREMTSPEGGYYAALDADSEGEEGKFYAWHKDEVRNSLNVAEYKVFELVYGLNRPANFEHLWHLHVFREPATLLQETSCTLNEIHALLFSARQKLFKLRKKRIHPGRDDKTLTAWNGLMIKGMAIAGRLLNRDDFIQSAESALLLIQQKIWQGNHLTASYKNGQAKFTAYLDDYAFLLDGILELLQCRWSATDFQFAQQLADILLEQFEDKEKFGFYFTAHNHEALLHRPKSTADEAMPSGAGVAAYALNRLGHLCSVPAYTRAAERAVKAVFPLLQKAANAHCTYLLALEELLHPPTIVYLRGEKTSLANWQSMLARYDFLNTIIIAIASDEKFLPIILPKHPVQGKTAAYLCQGAQCSLPIYNKEKLLKQLLKK